MNARNIWYAALLLFFATAFAVRCTNTPSPPPAPVNGWTLTSLGNVPLTASTGALWQFDFPTVPNHVNMAYTSARGFPDGHKLVAVIEEIEDKPAWVWKFEDSNTCNPGSLPQLHLYFQRAGDDFSGAGEKEFYRWWSTGFDIKPAEFWTITLGLEPALWTSVYGKRGTDNPTMFEAAKVNAANVGFSFGGGCFASHGVGVSSGKATLRLKSFTQS